MTIKYINHYLYSDNKLFTKKRFEHMISATLYLQTWWGYRITMTDFDTYELTI